MKYCILLLVLFARTVAAQSEFPVYANGLIYDEPTVKRLGVIVDSLNIRFRKCELSRAYTSFEQGRAVYVEIPSVAARKLIDEGISPDGYRQKTAGHKAKECWVTKYRNTYGTKKMLVYREMRSEYGAKEINLRDVRRNDRKTGWVISEDGGNAFWLEGLSNRDLPEKYGRLVQYVDCMVDTTSDSMITGAGEDDGRNPGDQVSEFVAWAQNFPNKPAAPDYQLLESKHLSFDSAYSLYNKRFRVWDSLRIISLDRTMDRYQFRKDLLAKATEEALESKRSTYEFELYVARYGSKKDALTLKRNRRVIGQCSMDQSPRYHAMEICLLSAEAAQWDVFLRSHLNVMNDRFERMSDGSYAYGGRKTYLRELEELDIDAIDLLLGTCFRVSNVSDRHYYGTISRIGRALTDASDKDAIEGRLLEMIADYRLDYFNRMIMVNTLRTYVSGLNDANRKDACEKELARVIEKMPDDLKLILAAN